MKSLVANASDRDQVQRAKRIERDIEQQQKEDLAYIMDLPQGRRFLWRILSLCHISGTSYSDSPNHTYFMEGERNVGLKIQAEMINADAKKYIRMQSEQLEKGE